MKGIVLHKSAAIVLLTMVALASVTLTAVAQSPQVQEKLAQIKEASAQNKQALAQYTWQEQDTISIKGDVKKQELYQVQMGPDGKPQKTPLNQQPPAQQDSGRHGRLKERIVEKKTEEFQDYAHQIAALAQSYAHPESGALQQSYQQGNLTLGSAGGPGEVQFVIKSFVKPNDQVTIVFNSAAKAIQSVQVSSYLDDPKDAVKIAVQFSKLPDGTNHVSTTNVDGVSKQLTVAILNSNYQKM